MSSRKPKTSAARSRKLSEYDAKRDFARTPEPAGGSGSAAAGGSASKGRQGRESRGKRVREQPRFVVHEHHARRLHWDLRLERDGALMSWAVPNGIPVDPKQNRKAIHVEDHPLSYLDFEGEIPQGSYGAGSITIWDRGHYECEKLEDGKLVVVFHGERLSGRFALFRTHGKDWMMHRMDPPAEPREPMPEQLVPMLAGVAPLPNDDQGWAYEVKWDGVRALTYWQPGRLRIESRNLKDITARYPELRALGPELGSHELILDGEIVAFDEQGRPSFERLQHRMHVGSATAIRRLAAAASVTYVIFDLLHLDGHDTTGLTYRERRALLQALALEGPAWQTPAYHEGDGRGLLSATAEHGLEGIMAKRLDSPYRPGRRSGDWLKVKNHQRQEFVVGGWLPGQGRRAAQFGALLVGYHEQHHAEPVLRYAGRVGTGFDEPELERLRGELAARARRSSPFEGVQPPRAAHYVEPELVVEVEFSSWTREGMLRHSSYKGQRADKAAADVELEQVEREQEELETTAPESDAPYEVLHETGRASEIEVQGRKLRLSNREKVMYPEVGFTKRALVDYYVNVAPVLLAHLAARPLTLKRYPNGVQAPYFYEKRCPKHRPDWVHTAAVWSERHKEQLDYCVVDDLPTLIWVANLASIELHTSLSRSADVAVPTVMVFDLDPGAPAGLRECCRVALRIREIFEAFGLQVCVKTSGSKGLQAYVPLNGDADYDQTKSFARAVAELLEQRHPKQVVSRMAKQLRPGRVLIDWSQNDQHKTTVNVYSLRARDRPTISTPLHWEEVERGARARREPDLSAEPQTLLERVEAHGDLFAPVLTLTQALPDLGGGEGSAPGAGGDTDDISSGRRGGLRSGRPGPRGRTREQLYNEARRLHVPGRSNMNKAELQHAVDAHK